MGISTNVFRRKGRYWFRIRVPADMVRRVGRREIWRSLGTADPGEARVRAARATVIASMVWQRVRSDMSLTKEQINELVVRHYQELLEVDERWRIADKPDLGWRDNPLINAALKVPYFTKGENGILEPTDEAMAEHIRSTGKHDFDVFADGFAHITKICTGVALETNDWADAKVVAEQVLADQGINEPYGSPGYRQLCMGLLRAMHEASKIMLARSAGDYSAIPADPLFKVVPAPLTMPPVQRRPATAPKLSKVVEDMLAEKPDITAKFKDDYRVAATAFEQTLGTTWWTEVTRREVAAFKDLLLHTPSNWSKRYRGKPLPEVVKLAAKDERPRLSSRTVNDKYLAPLSTVLKWAVTNGYITENPAHGVKVATAGKAARKKARAPFTVSQLQTLFDAPLFTGCRTNRDYRRPGTHRVRDHRFWVPLIGLFSGARLNEIGQLRKQDFERVSGIWCFRVTDEGDSERSLKTLAAVRLVPVHCELLSLGFADYIAGLGGEASDRVFPEWQKGADGYYSSVMSKWFGRLLEDLGLQDRKLVFHSFRHTFIDGLRAAGVEKTLRGALVGHETDDVEEVYGDGYPPAVLQRAVDDVSYAGLDLSKLTM